MSNEVKSSKVFRHGATWLRTDFHLHTKADKEFEYAGAEDHYYTNYVAGLEKAQIGVGVVTNHNKFNFAEYRELRRTAARKDICLLPGVELSVNDGFNGVHTLIVFSEQWLDGNKDYISPVITAMFPGKSESEYSNENGRSDKNILQVVEELEKTGRDYFLVFAHVEQRSGLWHEVSGGKIVNFTNRRHAVVRQRTLGFQKVRTHNKADTACRIQVKKWLGDWYPAELEGSDCKSVEEIGKGKKSFLKIGAFSFDAVKFALTDKDNRVSTEFKPYAHSRIRSVRFTGGTLNDQELRFSPELNTLIGIRGSGKSSILEVLRYALEIPFGGKASDKKYKENLVGFTLGSGGKVEIDAVDKFGQQYTIRRVWKEPHSDVLIDGILQPGLSIRETVLSKPIYFGQKDLSSTGEGFEKDLVDKLLGPKLDSVRQQIEQQKIKIAEVVDRFLKISNVQEQIDNQKNIQKDTEYRLRFYKEHRIEERLQKRLKFDNDVKIANKGILLTSDFITELEDLLAQYEDDLRNFRGHQSEYNTELFQKFYLKYESYISFIDYVKNWQIEEKSTRDSLNDYHNELIQIRKGMVEEFAEIERQLAEELRNDNTQNINSEDFLELKSKLDTANLLIPELEKQKARKDILQDELFAELQKLNEFWLEEFNLVKEELDKIGANNSSISITSGYKEDKLSFMDFMKKVFRGSGIWGTSFQGIINNYEDFIAVYKDFENAESHFGGSKTHAFPALFMENLKELLTYRTPDKFSIIYHDKELQHHSLGQRASALILFVLSQKENDVIIIDQPEDDLDNQTIYEDVIKLIRQMKPKVQFIFATHNPNIPVLGDAEFVHVCSFEKELVPSGSIDTPHTQKTIVSIMEGGLEAFNRRKEIYQIWKP